jgi:hypothetical protein
LLLLFLSIAPVAADSNDPPDLVVIKSSWSKTSKKKDASSQAPDSDDEVEGIDKKIEQDRRLEQIIRDSRRSPADASDYERQRRDDPLSLPASERTDGYLYKATFENKGSKTIKAVYWDYVFSDTETGAELDRHQFHSREKIGAGKKKELSQLTLSPPTRTVSAADKKDGPQFKESIIINRIEYTDESVWQRDSFTPPDTKK